MDDLAAVMQQPMALLAAAGLLMFLLLAGAFFVFGGGAARSAILIVGPSGAGKTALFHQLRDGDTFNDFVTSMEINEGSFPLSSEKGMSTKPIHVVDLPGHPRLRLKLDKFAPTAKGVVFLVDSTNIMPQIRGISEYMFEVLSRPELAKARVPVMLACNKVDLGARVHSLDFIQKKLEKEVESLRSTRGALQGSTGSDLALLNASQPFSFSNCRNKEPGAMPWTFSSPPCGLCRSQFAL